jgi:hypothetical protein
MELQGWRSESMFRRYAIVDTQDKLSALMLMEGTRTLVAQIPPQPAVNADSFHA